MHGNFLYAQSGGVTAVINQSAAGAIEQARLSPEIDKVFASLNGVTGILSEKLVDCSQGDLQDLAHSPGGYFGSCRYKLPSPDHPHYHSVMERIFQVFSAHNIRFFLYNGGGDSQDTLLKIARHAKAIHYPLACVGIPKTIDNDLPFTDCSPGFGSAAKYLAATTAEIACDLHAMHHNSTKLLVLETMGRNTGWLAAATSLAGDLDPLFEPDAIIVPEQVYTPKNLLNRCQQRIAEKGFALVVVSEGAVDQAHHTLSKPHDVDAFGHPQLGGIAPKIAHYLHHHLGVKTHWAVPDYMQRCARHLASATDLAQAKAVAVAAVELATQGISEVMTTIKRTQDCPYLWHVEHVAIEEVANREFSMPLDFVDASGLTITEQGKRYLRPLIQGESPPPFSGGLPSYGYCKRPLVAQQLAQFTMEE